MVVVVMDAANTAASATKNEALISRRIASVALLIMLLLGGSAGLAGCAERENPEEEDISLRTTLRTDYTSVDDLLEALDEACTSILALIPAQDHSRISRHVENLDIYVSDLKTFAPEDTDWAAVQRYDNYVRSIQNLNETVAYYARLRNLMRLRHEVQSMREYFDRVRALMENPPVGDSDELFHERLEPSPFDRGSSQ